MAHVLVVDDESTVRGSIRRLLTREGYNVSEAANGQEVLNQWSSIEPDVMVLDVIMPEMSGLELCRRLRSDPIVARLPIIFLTAKGRPDDISRGLIAGGNDYLVKPFDVLKLPDRIRAALHCVSGKSIDIPDDDLLLGELRLHVTRPGVEVNGMEVALSHVEHRLLSHLMLHAGQPRSTQSLLQAIWEYPDGTGNPYIVQAHIATLRSKIEPEPEIPRYVLSSGSDSYYLLQ